MQIERQSEQYGSLEELRTSHQTVERPSEADLDLLKGHRIRPGQNRLY